MLILAGAHDYFHYQDATLIQGLKALGHSVYLPPDYLTHLGAPECSYTERLPQDATDIDLFIQFVPKSKPLNGIKSVMVWGEDQLKGVEAEYDKGYVGVFVKDLPYRDGPGIPINYGIDERYYCETAAGYKPLHKRKIDISFLGSNHHGRRPFIEGLERDFYNRWIETGYRPFNEADDVWSRWTVSYRPCPAHDARYYEVLANTKVGLSLRGRGTDCARHWEVMASGAVPVIQLTDARVVQPQPMAVWFSEYHQLIDIIQSILSKPKDWQGFADAAYKWNKRHHSTVARAAYFLDIVSGL